MTDANDSESLRAYRNRVMIYATNLWQEKDPDKRATIALYLADTATTLARMEVEESRKLREASLSQVS